MIMYKVVNHLSSLFIMIYVILTIINTFILSELNCKIK